MQSWALRFLVVFIIESTYFLKNLFPVTYFYASPV